LSWGQSRIAPVAAASHPLAIIAPRLFVDGLDNSRCALQAMEPVRSRKVVRSTRLCVQSASTSTAVRGLLGRDDKNDRA
jgi:hypothetical protein